LVWWWGGGGGGGGGGMLDETMGITNVHDVERERRGGRMGVRLLLSDMVHPMFSDQR